MKRLFTNRHRVFPAMVLCILLSALILNSSPGILNDYQNRIRSEKPELRSLQIAFSDSVGKPVTKEELESCLFGFSGEILSSMTMIAVFPKVDGQILQCRFLIGEDGYRVCTEFRDNLTRFQKATGYFTEEQEAGGEAVALAPGGSLEETPDTGTVKLQGKEYEIIGTQLWCDTPIVPFASLEGDTKMEGEQGVLLEFSRAVTGKQYQEIRGRFTESFGEQARIPDMEEEGIDLGRFLQEGGWIAGLFILAAAMNFAILYQYLFLERRKRLAIYWLEGMSRFRMSFFYIKEGLIWLTAGYWAGTGIFHYVFLPRLGTVLVYMEELYGISVYLSLFLAYLAVSLLVLGILAVTEVRRMPVLQILQRNG